MHLTKKIFGYIGIFSPLILFIISSLILYTKPVLYSYYLVGLVFNTILNMVLKETFKDPRPEEDIKVIEIALHKGKRISSDVYGMPSAHAQNMGFSTMFIYYATKSETWTTFYFIVSVITMLQRYVFKNHTIAQVIIGFAVGCSVGYMFYYFFEKKMMGKLAFKADDFGPL